MVATLLGPGQIEVIPQQVQQGGPRGMAHALLRDSLPDFRRPAPRINTVLANCRQTHGQPCCLVQRRGTHMRFEIVAEKDSETVRMKRNSSLIAIAKARVWASEGWSVTIHVNENAPGLVKQLAPPLN